MGIFNHLSDVAELCECPPFSHGHSKLRKKHLQTVEIEVKMDCEGCERKVRKSVEGMKGVTGVEVDPK
ncbi:hypothetical protein SLEP1_g48960 [Rubroshorea leprosula]|uniref:HMA domain-containing protein n=1 Tax=Rubroshorea leprosula TaxID=152421 RepID=A0AAV5LVC6_9ROSI|nr:hypothetical protein SLEP1_g48960 [Rubroshorea leprosula]